MALTPEQFKKAAAKYESVGREKLSTSQSLYNVAQQRGGIVAQQAETIMNPQTSFLASVGNFFKTSLQKTIRVLNLSSNVVAGVLDKNKTIGEAIKENITPSDVLIGDIKPTTTLGKIGNFAGKLAIVS